MKITDGKAARYKGHTFERQVAKFLSEQTGCDIRRLLGQERDGGADLVCLPFLFQCKRYTKMRSMGDTWNTICQQAFQQALWPCLVYKLDYQPIQFVVPLSSIRESLPWDAYHTVTLNDATFAILLKSLRNPTTVEETQPASDYVLSPPS